VGRLGALPRYLTAAGAGERVGILYGDPEPPADSLYGTTVGSLGCHALPVRFDPERWKERFLAQWPPGSHGHRSYFARITRGTGLRPQQAARAGVQLTAHREQP
jgi:hypothetical protein